MDLYRKFVGFVICLFCVSSPGQSLVMSAASSSGVSNSKIPASKTTDKKLVIVTGGSRGIGKATSLWLASKGYQVAVNYRSEEQAAKNVVSEIESSGGKAAAFQADISDESQVKTMFEKVKAHFGMAPTGLVNNAGIMEPMEKDILKISTETLERDLRVNTMGTFFCTREFVKHCSINNKNEDGQGGKGGSVVVVSSVSAESAQILAYGMSKAALEAMVNGLSKQLPLVGIRINTVIPGLIDTGLASPEIIEAMTGFIPLRRAGDPCEVAQAIEFLLSDASSYCSGTKLRVAGGL